MMEFFEKIFNRHKLKLKNLQVENSKLIICFAGIPGSGKTKVAKKLEERYKGVRINSEDIGRIINDITEDLKEKRAVQNNYIYWLISENIFRNKLFIMDSGIDRKYKEVFDLANKNEFEIFIIQIEVPLEILRERIKSRNKENAQVYYKELERWKMEHEKFKNDVEPNYILDNSKNFDLNGLYKVLDQKVLEVNS